MGGWDGRSGMDCTCIVWDISSMGIMTYWRTGKLSSILLPNSWYFWFCSMYELKSVCGFVFCSVLIEEVED